MALITATHQFLMFLFLPPRLPPPNISSSSSLTVAPKHNELVPFLSSNSNEKRHNVSFCLSHTYVFAGDFALCKTASSVMRLHVIQLLVIISPFYSSFSHFLESREQS